MSHMIDPKAIPVTALVGSFLKAMAAHGTETCVVFKHGTQVAVASNREGAETMAKSVFAIQDGAIETAAIALHAYRVTPAAETAAKDGTDPNNPATVALCSLVMCAGHELEHALQNGGEPVKWDDLPEPIRAAHRIVAQAVIAAAVAHKVPEDSKIVKPV
jgi:hypothetical protein